MEADGALGDGEAYAEASGVGAAGLVDSVEGAEDVGEVGFGDAGAVVGDFDGGVVAGVRLGWGRGWTSKMRMETSVLGLV